ncbi:hypothetical protein ACSFV5_05685 [Acinetobacter sp. HC8-3S]
MENTRRHLISLAVLTALSLTVPATTFAQLHLEIAKAPEQAPKIAIVPFGNDNNALYPIIENDLNRSGRFYKCITKSSCDCTTQSDPSG